MRILVVEDDDVIAECIQAGLQKSFYEVDIADDGEIGLRMAENAAYSLIILDLMLPKRDGWAVCERLRQKRNSVPILMLTARATVDDRIKGLDCGADDYLPKPFDFNELHARVRALLRRDKLHKGRLIRIADLEIDTLSRKVRRGEQDVYLTPREYALLEALARNEGRTLSRDFILERIWGDDESYSNTVSFHVALLRKKIDNGNDTRLIHTVHGVGYVLRPPQ